MSNSTELTIEQVHRIEDARHAFEAATEKMEVDFKIKSAQFFQIYPKDAEKAEKDHKIAWAKAREQVETDAIRELATAMGLRFSRVKGVWDNAPNF